MTNFKNKDNEPTRVYEIQNYIPHIGQQQLHNSTSKRVMIVSSTRAGKTESLIHDIIVNAWNNKSKYGILVGAPTNNMVSELLEYPIAQKLEQDYDLLFHHFKSSHKVQLKNNKIIYFVTLEKDAVDQSVRGKNVSDIYVDEAAYVDEYSMKVIKPRLLTTNGRLIMATTPKGKNNWVYEDYFSRGKKKGVEYITYRLQDNPSISAEAIEELKKDYDELMYRQEVLAEFINLYENAVYYSFSDENIGDFKYNNGLYTYVGIDFNVNKNAWIAVQKYPDNTLRVIYEGYGAKTTTDAAHQIISKFGSRVIVVPDQTGKALQGSGTTNIQLLRQAGLSSVVEESSNPNRERRYALMNAYFCNALGQRRLLVDKDCKETIRELRELSYKKDSNMIDDKGDKIGHRTDALGYVTYYLQDYVGKILDNSMSWWKKAKIQQKYQEIHQTTAIY